MALAQSRPAPVARRRSWPTPRAALADAFAATASAAPRRFGDPRCGAERAQRRALHRLCGRRPGGDGDRHAAERAGRPRARSTRASAAGMRPEIDRAYHAVRDPNAYRPGRIPRRAAAGRGARSRACNDARSRFGTVLACAALALAPAAAAAAAGGGGQPRPPRPPPRPPRQPLHRARRRGPERRRRQTDHRPGRGRGAGARHAGGDRGHRPGRQCAGGLSAWPARRRRRPSAPRRPAAQHSTLQGAGGRRPPRAAIAKAITGAYLSSGGNAFSTRTASRSCSRHFPPQPATRRAWTADRCSACSSASCPVRTSRAFPRPAAPSLIGPKRSPLGLAADPGGFPLYKNGVLVGGVGVMADGDYGFDPDVLGHRQRRATRDIALAATVGFAAPVRHHRRPDHGRRHLAALQRRHHGRL